MQIFTEKLKVPDERSPEGNAYVIMGFVEKAMDMAYNATGDEIFNKDAKKAYSADAMSSDYQHLRKVSQEMLDKMNNYEGIIF